MDYIFQGLPKPFNILGQDSCRKIQTSSGNYLTIIGGSREIFLKTLLNTLCVGCPGANVFNNNDTILIDYNIVKSICRDVENSIFLQT
jgi:hypothetical protein